MFFLETLYRGYAWNLEKRRSYYFCSDTDVYQLTWLSRHLVPQETICVILPRKIEEFQLLTITFSLPWKAVLLGSTHGVVAEVARNAFLSFFPMEEGYYHFWHRGELAYLPLLSWGVNVQEFDRGLNRGYHLLQEEAIALALLLGREQTMFKEICFVVDNHFFLSLLTAFLSLLEKSCQGENAPLFTVKDFFALRDIYCESPLGEEKIHSTLFVLFHNEGKSSGLHFHFPPELKRDLFFEEWQLLKRSCIDRFVEAEISTLHSFLRGEHVSSVDVSLQDTDIATIGQLIALFHQWACYNGWLRGLDLLSDPPIIHFEHLVRSRLRKEETRR